MITQGFSKEVQYVLNLRIDSLKIRSFTENDGRDLDNYLLTMSKYIGITEPPEDDVRKHVIKFLKQHFSDFSKEEIGLAVNMATARKLDVEDIKHYNKLTAQWLADILIAYRKMRGLEMMKLNSKMSELERKKNQPTLAQIDKRLAESTIRIFDRYYKERKKAKDKTKLKIVDWGNPTHGFLTEKNILEIDGKDKEEILKRASEIMKETLVGQLKKSPNENAKKTILATLKKMENGNENMGVKSEAKNLELKFYFDKLITTKKHISTYLKKYTDEDIA